MAQQETKAEEKSRAELLRELEVLRALVSEAERTEEHRRKVQESRDIMLAISEAVHRAASLEQLYKEIHESLGKVVYARNFFIALYHEETELFSFPYAVDESGDEYDPRPHDLSDSMTSLVLKSGKPILADKATFERFTDEGRIRMIGSPAASWIGVPLITRGTVIGVMVVQSYRDGILYTSDDVDVMSFVSEQVATAIERKRSEEELAAAYARMKHDLSMASRVQRSMLPHEPPALAGWEFAWMFSPCDEIAGDMFNVYMLDKEHAGLYVLDVAGHGMQAALLSVTLNHIMLPSHGAASLLRRPSGDGGYELTAPRDVARILNDQFPLRLETNQFFTMIYGILNLETGVFRYVRAGHHPPIHVARGGVAYLGCEGGPSIGILPEATYEECDVQLSPGEALVLHTDGLDEAFNARNQDYGRDRLLSLLRTHHDATAHTIVADLEDDFRRFTRGVRQHDDVTIFCVKRQRPVED